MRNRTTYAVGALIIPDGRVILSVEGDTKFKYSMISGLSVETFIPEIERDVKSELVLITEAKNTLGVDLKQEPSISKIAEAEVTIKTSNNFKRDLKLYVYKISSLYTFNVKAGRDHSIMFLSIGQIAKQALNDSLNLSFCAKHMLKYLCSCKNFKNFTGNLKH